MWENSPPNPRGGTERKLEEGPGVSENGVPGGPSAGVSGWGWGASRLVLQVRGVPYTGFRQPWEGAAPLG